VSVSVSAASAAPGPIGFRWFGVPPFCGSNAYGTVFAAPSWFISFSSHARHLTASSAVSGVERRHGHVEGHDVVAARDGLLDVAVDVEEQLAPAAPALRRLAEELERVLGE
jgi:hypothetical protein